MTTLTTTSGNSQKLLSLAPLAGLIAAVINAVLFYIGIATGAIPDTVIIPNAGQPLTIVPVLVASFAPAIVGGLVLALLNRFTKQPFRIFTVIAVIVLALSFFSPFSIPGAPIGMIVILELMHVVVVAVVLITFNRLTNRQAD